MRMEGFARKRARFDGLMNVETVTVRKDVTNPPTVDEQKGRREAKEEVKPVKEKVKPVKEKLKPPPRTSQSLLLHFSSDRPVSPSQVLHHRDSSPFPFAPSELSVMTLNRSQLWPNFLRLESSRLSRRGRLLKEREEGTG